MSMYHIVGTNKTSNDSMNGSRGRNYNHISSAGSSCPRRFIRKAAPSPSQTQQFLSYSIVVILLLTALTCVVPAIVRTTSCTALLHPNLPVSIGRSVGASRYRHPPARNHHHTSIAWVPSTPPMATTTSSTTATSQLHLSFMNWDDVIYQTETLANTLASVSLQQTMMSDSTNSNNALWAAFPIMYGAGLLTSFSPCVWGLLPLTMSYISAAANERRDQQTLWPTIAFAAGLAFVFCTLGIIAVSVGSVFGSTAVTTASTAGMSSMDSNAAMAWTAMVLPFLSNFVCLIMGLKLLDLIDIPLPSLSYLRNPQQLFSFNAMDGMKTATSTTATSGPILLDGTGRQVVASPTTSSSSPTRNQKQDEGNALVRTFLLGGSSALVASPCATPVLTSILAFVANAAESTSTTSTVSQGFTTTIIGAFLLFGYTLGYATPLLIVAGTGGQALVQLKQQQQQPQHVGTVFSWSSIPRMVAPWVTPVTGGILLYLSTTGLLTTVFGDPSMIGLTIIE
jgi:cytochrome c-type biogenesis protein